MIPSIARTPKCAVKSSHAAFKLFRMPELFAKNPKKENSHMALNIERGKIIRINLLEISGGCVVLSMEMPNIRRRQGERIRKPRHEHPITRPENFLIAN